MNADELIESYVADVAGRLPRAQRNDVAFELRALLTEELQGRAEAAGRPADAAMANALLQGFGLPADVAARYRPTLTIIDPADGHRFVRLSVIGLVVIWGLGLLAHLQRAQGSGVEFLSVLGSFWVNTLIPSLWWPGVLVVGFGLASWSRRRRPQAEWKPRTGDRAPIHRVGLVMGLIGILCGVYVLFDPTWVLDVVSRGAAAPAAYEALTYTDTFRHRQGPWVLALLVLNVPLLIAATVTGRWSNVMRRVDVGLSVITCAVLAWTVFDGPIFMVDASDRMAKFILVLILLMSLIDIGVKLHRSVRPAPRVA